MMELNKSLGVSQIINTRPGGNESNGLTNSQFRLFPMMNNTIRKGMDHDDEMTDTSKAEYDDEEDDEEEEEDDEVTVQKMLNILSNTASIVRNKDKVEQFFNPKFSSMKNSGSINNSPSISLNSSLNLQSSLSNSLNNLISNLDTRITDNSSPQPDDAAEAPSLSSPSSEDESSDMEDDLSSPIQRENSKFSNLSLSSPKSNLHGHNQQNVPKNCTYNNCCICKYGPPPSFFTSAPTWADICYIGLYCLTISKPEIAYFHIKKDICTFIDAHYETICMRKRTSIWRQTVNMTLSHPQYFEMFQQESALENGRKGYYGLKQVHDPYEHTALNKRSRRKRRHEQKMIQEELKKNGITNLILNSPVSQPLASSFYASTSPISSTTQSPFYNGVNSSNSNNSINNNSNNILTPQKSPFLRLDIQQQTPPSNSQSLQTLQDSSSPSLNKKMKLNNDRSIILRSPTNLNTNNVGKKGLDDILNSNSNSNIDEFEFHSFKYNKTILPKLEDDDYEQSNQPTLDETEREVPKLNKMLTDNNKSIYSNQNSRSNSPSPLNSRSNSPSTSPSNINNPLCSSTNGQNMNWGGSSLSSSGTTMNLDDDMDCLDDDDDDDDESPKKRMRKTTRPEEKSMLEKYYQHHYSSNAKHCKEELSILSSNLGWKINRIQRWLDNRRTKDKLKHLRTTQERGTYYPPCSSGGQVPNQNHSSFSVSSSPIIPMTTIPSSPIVPNNPLNMKSQSPIHFSSKFNTNINPNNRNLSQNQVPSSISSSSINSLLN